MLLFDSGSDFNRIPSFEFKYDGASCGAVWASMTCAEHPGIHCLERETSMLIAMRLAEHKVHDVLKVINHSLTPYALSDEKCQTG